MTILDAVYMVAAILIGALIVAQIIDWGSQ
jgi:hypothetical protein